MITGLSLRNFKAFEEVSLDIKPITILLGPNNSGKSSILAALRMLVQTAGSNDDKIVLLLNGPLGEFGTYKDIVYGNNLGRAIDINLAFKIGKWDAELVLTYNYNIQHRQLTLNNTQIKDDEFSLKTEYKIDSAKHNITYIGTQNTPLSLHDELSNIIEMNNFIPKPSTTSIIKNKRKLNKELQTFLTEPIIYHFSAIEDIARYLHNMLTNWVEYIGAMRFPPSRTYLFSGEQRSRIGIAGENSINILTMNPNSDMYKNIDYVTKSVNSWLQKAGIASDFRVDPLTDRHYEIRVQHPITKEYQNLADVGYGNSQVIPVLIGGYRLEPGHTYMVEQPELHLHPRAQAELGDFVLDLYNNEVQPLIETHSEHLILRLQQHVANGLIPPDDIQVYYIYAKDEKKIAQAMHLDEKGRFTNPWPEGFFPERLEEAKKLSRVRAKPQTA